ncbi:MAG: inorganic phosphate transporter [Candidatus Omnitrophota bacterium]|nr:inorganic phosphate transporter [Candidatus Omnitrophota bacterium]
MIKYIILIFVMVFFSLNMGASGIAPSFASTYGARLIKKKTAIFLFSFFVILGAVILGRNVAITLGKDLLPKEVMRFDVVLVVLVAGALSLFLANVLRIPQSTSQVTVGAIVGAGLYFRQINLKVLCFKILPAWVILPLVSYFLTLLIYRAIYPPKHDNFHIYEKIFANEKKMKIAALVVSAYVSFAIGTNNVANAVGPLSGAGLIGIGAGLLIIAPFFGIGAFLMGDGPLETAGKEIVPLGLMSSTLVSFVTATLLIVASIIGIPQSLVQLNLAAIFAISCLKNGHKYTWDQHIVKKTFFVWTITPLLSVAVSYLLLNLFLKR